MIKKLLEHFINQVVVPYLEPRLRTGSIKAAKAYIEAVRLTRTLVLRGFVIGSLSAILITGVLMLIFGVLALLPLMPQVIPIVAIVLGTLFAGSTGIGFYIFFREKNWLTVSKAYEVMEAATAPWESEIKPPNPLAVFRGEGPHGHLFEDLAKSQKNSGDRFEKKTADISSAVIAADKSHVPHTDVAAANIGGSAAIMAPEAPLIIPPSRNQPAYS